MIDSIHQWWERLSGWMKIAIGVGGLWTIMSVARTWSEPRPVGGFFEEFVGLIIVDVSTIGSYVAGIAAGMYTHSRTKNAWIA